MATTQKTVEVRHEEFCLPRPDEDGPRIERYTAYRDGERGRSVPAFVVTRCQECGAAEYDPAD